MINCYQNNSINKYLHLLLHIWHLNLHLNGKIKKELLIKLY